MTGTFYDNFSELSINILLSNTNMIRKIGLIIGLLPLSVECFSQTKDSIESVRDSVTISHSQRVAAYVAEKIAAARPLNLEYTFNAPYSFTSERFGGAKIPESRMERFNVFEASSNFNFLQKKNWFMGTTLAYRNISTQATIAEPGTRNIRNVEHDYHYFSANLNFSYFSTLFGKRTIYTSSLMSDGSNQHVERVRGVLIGTMILKANERTKMTVGILGIIDPSEQFPVLPTFSLEHEFRNGIIADIALPSYFYVRKYVLTRGRLSLGSEFDRTSFYMYNIDGTSQRYEYRQFDFNSGLVYEHLVGKHFILTAKTGVRATITGRLFRKEDNFRDYVIETRSDPAFYANLGISFNPMILFNKNP